MKKNPFLVCLGLLACSSAIGCAPPPKVMTSHQYLAESRSAKSLLQDSGATVDEQKLFNYFVRVCNLDSAAEKQCKDTLVLENVTPGSLY